MSDLIEEIKEDVRFDQLIKFFRTYANYIISAVLVGLIFSASYIFWQHSKEKQQQVMATRFDQALQESMNGHNKQAMALLTALEQSASSGYKTLVAFRRSMLESNSSEEIVRIYTEIMHDSKIEPKFRELATVLWGYETIDSEGEAHLREKLEPIAQSKSPWMNSASELLAFLDIRTGKTGAAIQRLKTLNDDENVVSGIRARAFALLEQLGG